MDFAWSRNNEPSTPYDFMTVSAKAYMFEVDRKEAAEMLAASGKGLLRTGSRTLGKPDGTIENAVYTFLEPFTGATRHELVNLYANGSIGPAEGGAKYSDVDAFESGNGKLLAPPNLLDSRDIAHAMLTRAANQTDLRWVILFRKSSSERGFYVASRFDKTKPNEIKNVLFKHDADRPADVIYFPEGDAKNGRRYTSMAKFVNAICKERSFALMEATIPVYFNTLCERQRLAEADDERKEEEDNGERVVDYYYRACQNARMWSLHEILQV